MLDVLDTQPIRALVGPTASGKSGLALELAERAGAEVLSLDSMLVYRGMDIGTAKPSAAERARVRHHLVDLVEPSERYDVHCYLRDARVALADVYARDRQALFVGGTGFYLAALLRGLFAGPPADLVLRARLEARLAEVGEQALHAELRALDPASAEKLHPHDSRRVVRALEVHEQTGTPLSEHQAEWSRARQPRVEAARLVGLAPPPAELEARIPARTTAMFDAGWVQEATALRAAGELSETAVQALGYDIVLAHADGELTRGEAEARVALRTRQFARRQRTWYRKFDILWLDPADPGTAARALEHLGW